MVSFGYSTAPVEFVELIVQITHVRPCFNDAGPPASDKE